MRVLWDGRRRYRTFSEPSRRTVSLVSSWISDEASGVTIDDVLLMVTDQACRFCDLELKLDPAHQAAGLVELGDASLVEGEVETEVSEAEPVLWRYEGELRVLQIVLGNEPVKRWVTLKGDHVTIGLGSNEAWRVLHCREVVSDPTGTLQSEWLQEIEQGMAMRVNRP